MKLSMFSLVFGILVASLIGFSSVPAFANENNNVLPFSSGTIITGSSTTSTVLSFSSSIIISTSSTTTGTGIPVTLNFYETNDGILSLESPTVTSDSLLCDPEYVSGDDGNDVLDSGEVWHFTCDVEFDIPSTKIIVLTGFGIDPYGNEVTWPGDLDEQITATVEVISIESGINDHYLSYKAKESHESKHPKESKHQKKPKHSDKFEVTLDDQFESATYTVEKTDRLYNPVQKTHDGITIEITDSESHYVGYKIKTPKGADKFEKVTNVLVTNQFGDITVDVKKAKLLLVPSAKSHTEVPGMLDDPVNHYKCYDAKETKHTPKFEKRIVSLYDPNFEIIQEFEVKKPKYLCTPVKKTHDGVTTSITDEENHLMCYDVKKIKDAPKFEKRNVFTNNQFGPEKLKVEKQEELCVPSIKTLP